MAAHCYVDLTDQENARKLGHIARLNGHQNEALEIWAFADIDVAAMYVVMGRYEDFKGFGPHALTWYRMALELDSQNAGYWNEYAIVLRDEGDIEMALNAFAKAVELGSSDLLFVVEAVPPLNPSSPGGLMRSVIAAVSGALVGVIGGFLLDYMNFDSTPGVFWRQLWKKEPRSA